MLQIDKVQQVEGVTAYGDNERFNVFYLLPQQPRYRLNADGTPSFRFLKYRFPIDRPGNKKGGGFLLFDAEFVVDEKKLPKIKEVLGAQVAAEATRRGVSPAPDVVLGPITYTKGETKLFVAGSDGTFVEKLNNPGKPSLFGNNVTTFALELTQEGATFFEQAMQGAGGSVSIVYELTFWARLPPVNVHGYFHAEKFYSFYQTIDTDWNLWSEDSYRETVREQMRQSESMLVTVDPGGVTDQKLLGSIRDWATKSLEAAVQRNMIAAIAPVPDDQRKLPDGIEDVTRDITSTKITDVSVHYREAQTVEWPANPQGVLQNITELTVNGAKLKWADYSKVIDLDDPFFRQLRVDTFVNADFVGLPIHSVEVKLVYKGRPMPNLTEGEPEGEVVLNKPDKVGKFAAFVEANDWKYKYSYQVNYKGQSRIYQSPEVETNEGNLTIGVDDVGILSVDVASGDINWTEVELAQVTFQYEDADVPLIERQFSLTQATPTFKIQQVIFQPMRKNYRYRVKYVMKGSGTEYEGSWTDGRSPNLFVNDVFGGRKTVNLRGIGDFTNRIQNVFVNLDYDDARNHYHQSKSHALSSASTSLDWTFPVVSEANGTVTYSATVSFKDGTPAESIPKTEATTGTILLPPPAQDILDVQLITDLIDWAQVRLARVSLSYADTENNVRFAKDIIFSPTNKANTNWKIELKNRTRDKYTFKVVYFLAGGLQKTVGPTDTPERALILDPNG
jgi:hypothetical protein